MSLSDWWIFLGLVSKVTLQKSKTDVSASLKDVIIFYHLPEALYPKVSSTASASYAQWQCVCTHLLDM